MFQKIGANCLVAAYVIDMTKVEDDSDKVEECEVREDVQYCCQDFKVCLTR